MVRNCVSAALTSPALTSPALTWPALTWPALPWPGLPWPALTWPALTSPQAGHVVDAESGTAGSTFVTGAWQHYWPFHHDVSQSRCFAMHV